MLVTLQEHLRRIIQDSVDGHDSKEDALACLDLMKMKAVSEVKHGHYFWEGFQKKPGKLSTFGG